MRNRKLLLLFSTKQNQFPPSKQYNCAHISHLQMNDVVNHMTKKLRPYKHTARCTIILFPSHLVKAEDWELATDVDAWWTDAEDALVLKSALCIDGAGGESCRQCRRHYNGHNVQSPNDQLRPGGLDIHQDRSQPVTSFHRRLHVLHHVDTKPTSCVTMGINRNCELKVIICFLTVKFNRVW